MDLSPAGCEKESTPGRSEIGRNVLWMSWSGVISIANSVLVWIFMARLRDVDEVGRFAIVMGLYALFFSIVSLGLMPYMINEISRRREVKDATVGMVSAFISSASAFLLISGVVSAGLMTICAFALSGSWQVRISALVLSLALIPTGLVTVSEATAISYGRARLVAAVTTLENLLRTIIPVALIWAGYDMFVICLSFASVRFIALAAYVIVARVHLRSFDLRWHEFRRLISVCPTFAGTIVFASINWQIALILVGYLSTESQSAIYGAASRFLIPVSILMASYANVIQPSIARYTEETRENLGASLSHFARVPLVVATIIAVVSPFLSGPVLTFLYGAKYEAAATTLDILALSVIPFCVVIVVARGLVATNSQQVDLVANILGVIVCFVAAVELIPRYGAAGAAAAQLFSFLSMALVEIVYASRKMSGFSIWRAASLSSVGLVIIYAFLWKQ